MNAEKLIRMLARMLLRKGTNRAIGAAAKRVGKGKDAPPKTNAQREAAKRARQAAKVTRRTMR